MIITDKEVLKMLKKLNSYDVEESLLSYPEDERDGRSDMEIFLKHYNNSGNSVFVITPEKMVEKMKDYLTGFNSSEFTVEIWDEEIVPTVTPVIDWSSNWNSNCDWEELENTEVLPYAD